jgi:hypothetical protein
MNISVLLFESKNIRVQGLCRYNILNKECMETAGSENCDSYSFSKHALSEQFIEAFEICHTPQHTRFNRIYF